VKYTIASVISLLLCVATAVLWVRSYTRYDEVRLGVERNETAEVFLIASDNGGVLLFTDSKPLADTFKPGMTWTTRPINRAAKMPATFWARHNFDALNWNYTWMIARGVEVPHWLVVILTAVLPAVFVWRSWRRPSGQARCSTCDYNLTGNTSGVCPECGTPIPQKSEAAA